MGTDKEYEVGESLIFRDGWDADTISFLIGKGYSIEMSLSDDKSTKVTITATPDSKRKNIDEMTLLEVFMNPDKLRGKDENEVCSVKMIYDDLKYIYFTVNYMRHVNRAERSKSRLEHECF